MTYRTVRDWVPLEELLALSLGDRVKQVRETLASPNPRARKAYMSHDEFSALLGIAGRNTVIRWEKDGPPPYRAQQIAELTEGRYPAAAFGGAGAIDLMASSFATRLRSAEVRVDRLIGVVQSMIRSLSMSDALRSELEAELRVEGPPLQEHQDGGQA